jgi:hypothetical protein
MDNEEFLVSVPPPSLLLLLLLAVSVPPPPLCLVVGFSEIGGGLDRCDARGSAAADAGAFGIDAAETDAAADAVDEGRPDTDLTDALVSASFTFFPNPKTLTLPIFFSLLVTEDALARSIALADGPLSNVETRSRTDSLAESGFGAAAGAGGAEEGWGTKSVHDTMLLASGSADNRVYVFDVGSARGAKLVQRLEGHTDRVHGVSFHPQDPLLASCSADCSIKIWGAKSDRYRNG